MDYSEDVMYLEKKVISKRKLKTADFKKAKIYTRLSEAIFEGDWDIARRYMCKIKNPKIVKTKNKDGNFKRSYKVKSNRTKYNSLPGVNASEQTRFVGQLEYLVDNEISTDVEFHIDQEGIARYKI